jgi:tetratricopeptide (TPR) repeat protein
MEPIYKPDMGPQQQSSVNVAPMRKQSRLHKYVKLVRKYWYVTLALLAIVIGLVTWQVIQSNQEATWKKASDYFTRADYGNAEKQLHSVAIPSDADHLRVYAQTMLATQNLDKSLTAYQKLYELNKDPSIKLIIGNIYNQQKKYDDAIKIYREIITNNAGNVQAYINLSTVYKLQNNTPEAIKVADEAVKNNPSSVVLRELQVSMVMDNKSSAGYKAAVKDLKALNPSDPLLQALNE